MEFMILAGKSWKNRNVIAAVDGSS